MWKSKRNELFYIIDGFWTRETWEKIWAVQSIGRRSNGNCAVNKGKVYSKAGCKKL